MDLTHLKNKFADLFYKNKITAVYIKEVKEKVKKELEEGIEIAKKIGVHVLLVFDAKPTGRFKHRKDLIDNPHWIDDMTLVLCKFLKHWQLIGFLEST